MGLFALSLLHRLLALLILFAIPLAVQPFDSSAQLLSSPSNASPWRLSNYLVRWDSLHFLGAASPEALPPVGDMASSDGGYQWENTLAFQPALVWLLRFAGNMGAGGWNIDASVGWTTAFALLSSSLCPPLLYQ